MAKELDASLLLPPLVGFLPASDTRIQGTVNLADNPVLQNRRDEAQALFERLLELRNDMGLLAEEYYPRARSMLSNFPQASSHVALINTTLTPARTDAVDVKRGTNEA